MYATALLPLVCALAAALPSSMNHSRLLDDTQLDKQTDDPTKFDPTPSSGRVAFPTGLPEDPWPSGLPTVPDECEGQEFSEDCYTALGSGTGRVHIAKDSKCSAEQQRRIGTAFWDALKLATYSSTFPDGTLGGHSMYIGKYYMGVDWRDYVDRIAGNFARVARFNTQASNTYITVSCNDVENDCNLGGSGKSTGGVAVTKPGWFGKVDHRVLLCPIFFGAPNLEEKLDDVETDLRKHDTTMAEDMDWLKNTGQLFLHEMMHLGFANGKSEPHIEDKYVFPADKRGTKGYNNFKAYGPRWVARMAADGGGASRTTINADSYATVANAAFWWDTTGLFPGSPRADQDIEKNKRKKGASTLDNEDNEDQMVILHADLTHSDDPSAANLTSMFIADYEAYGFTGTPSMDGSVEGDDGAITNDEPAVESEPNDEETEDEENPIDDSVDGEGSPEEAADDEAPPEEVSDEPSIDEQPPADDEEEAPEPTQICGYWYEALWGHFEIYGKDFDPDLFQEGVGLKKQLKGCGGLSKWHYEELVDDPQGMQWFAKGRLLIGNKGCTGRAVVSAGGSGPDGCTGSG